MTYNKYLNYFFFALLFMLSLLFSSHSYFLFEFFFTMLYFFTVIALIKKEGFIGIYQFYLYTSGLFLYSRIFFDFINYDSFLHVSFPGTHYYSYDIGIVYLTICYLHVFIVDFVYNYKNSKISVNLITYKKGEEEIGKVSFALLLLIFPLVLYKMYLQYMYVRQNGYLSIFIGDGLATLNYPFFLRGIPTLFVILLVFVLYSGNVKQVRISLILFLVFELSNSLKGQRTLFISSVLLVLFFLVTRLGKKIKFRQLLVLLVGLVLFSQVMLINRDKNQKANFKNSTVISDFFYQQGTSIVVPLYTIENYHLNNYRTGFYLFNPIKNLFITRLYPTSGQTKTRLVHYNYLSDQIEFDFFPEGYYLGNGVGSSDLAEYYDFYKYFGVALFSIVLALILKFISNNFYRSFFSFIFSFYSLQTIIMMPRSPGGGLLNCIPTVLFQILLLLLFHLFVKFSVK